MRSTQVGGLPERRKRVRSQVHWPVCFFADESGHTVETTTENLSSSGFYCFSPVPLIAGDLMVCLLRVPSHHCNGRSLSLECKVRVVRVEPQDDRKFHGVACHIEDYRFTFSAVHQISSQCLPTPGHA